MRVGGVPELCYAPVRGLCLLRGVAAEVECDTVELLLVYVLVSRERCLVLFLYVSLGEELGQPRLRLCLRIGCYVLVADEVCRLRYDDIRVGSLADRYRVA